MSLIKCPDCWGDAIFGSAGDGVCSGCKGTGLGNLLDQMSSSLFDYESECDECDGSGTCQTCGGDGMISDW